MTENARNDGFENAVSDTECLESPLETETKQVSGRPRIDSTRLAYLFYQHWLQNGEGREPPYQDSTLADPPDASAAAPTSREPHIGRNSGRSKHYANGRPVPRRNSAAVGRPAPPITSARREHLLRHHWLPTRGPPPAPPEWVAGPEPVTADPPSAPARGNPARLGRNSGRAPRARDSDDLVMLPPPDVTAGADPAAGAGGGGGAPGRGAGRPAPPALPPG